MITARIFREGPGWSAHCDAVGVYTQGPTRAEAVANLGEAIELQANRRGMRIRVSDLHGESLFVSANEPRLLAAEVLKHQRELHGLSLSDVARRLGVSSVNAYAAYEQGKREPSLGKYHELLEAIAPELALTIAPRPRPVKVAKAAAKQVRSRRRPTAA